MSCRRLVLLASLAVPTFFAAPSSADEKLAPRSRLAYVVPATCPSEARFRELLAERSEVVVDDAAAITMRVEVVKQAGRFRGRVVLLTETEEGARELSANRCEDVVRGLALFSALALDAYFERRTAEDVRPPQVVDGPGEPVAVATVFTERRYAPPPTARGEEPRGLRAWFGVGVGQEAVSRGHLSHLVGIFAELEFAHTPRTSVRASLLGGAVDPKSHADGTLSMAVGWLRVEACPARLAVGRSVLLGVCPAGEVGVQRAALDGRVGGRSELHPWVAVGALGNVRTDLGHAVAVQAAVGALVPLRPVDFQTLNGVAYSTPSIAPAVQLDLVVPLN